MRAIVFKELRENLKWLPVGLLLIGIFAWLACPVNAQDVYSASNANLTFSIAIGAGLYAVLLGGLQSAFDFSDRQRGFLFHRGVSSQRIIYGKVIAGAVLYAIACAGPLLCLTVWFYWKGPEFIPVRPAQLVPAMLACAGCFALHPATMLTFLREARWLGTRLLPLIATAASAVLLVNGMAASRVNELLIVALLSLPVLMMSYWAIRKPGWSRAALLVVGAVCVAFLVFIAALTVEQSIKNPTLQAGRYSYTQYGLDQTGDVWGYRTETKLSPNGYDAIQVPVLGDKLQIDRPPNVAKELPAGFEVYGLSYLQPVSESPSPFAYIEYANAYGNSILCYDSRGFLLLYKRELDTGLNKFSGTVSKQGFHPPGKVPGERFTSNAPQRGLAATSSLGGLAAYSIWLDTQGVYQFDWKSGSLRTLLELPIESAGATLSVPDRAPQLMLQSEGQIHHFAVLDQAGSSDWFDANLVGNGSYQLDTPVPDLQLRPIATLPPLPADISRRYLMASVTGGKYVVLKQSPRFMVVRMAAGNEAQWQFDNVQPARNTPTAAEWSLALMPAGLWGGSLAAVMVYNSLNGLPLGHGLTLATGTVPNASNLVWLGMVAMLVTLCLVVFTVRLARTRGLTRKGTWLLGLATVVSGLTAPIALCALFPKLVFEPCPRCDHARRVDRARCQHCSSPWEPPPAEGIEIFEQAPQLAALRNADLVQ